MTAFSYLHVKEPIKNQFEWGGGEDCLKRTLLEAAIFVEIRYLKDVSKIQEK